MPDPANKRNKSYKAALEMPYWPLTWAAAQVTEPLPTGNWHLSEKRTLAHLATVRSFLSSWSLTSPVQEQLDAKNVIWIRPCAVALEALTPAAFHSLNSPWISIISLNGLRFAPFPGHFFVLSALQECAWVQPASSAVSSCVRVCRRSMIVL